MDRLSLKPSVPKFWLIALAGLVWMAAGALLCRLSFLWIVSFDGTRGVVLGFVGLVLALAAYLALFSGIVRKNITRISSYTDKGCVFAFQAWRSYLIIVVMVLLGNVMKQSTVSREVLAVVYATMGGALVMSGIRYVIHLFRPKGKTDRKTCENGDSA